MVKLSSQQFAIIFESLQVASAAKGSEKRVSTRMEVLTTVNLAQLNAQGKIVRCLSGLTPRPVHVRRRLSSSACRPSRGACS
jgi:hypothetical protein